MISPVVNLDNAKDRSARGEVRDGTGTPLQGFVRFTTTLYVNVRPAVASQHDSWPRSVRRARLVLKFLQTFLNVPSQNEVSLVLNLRKEDCVCAN